MAYYYAIVRIPPGLVRFWGGGEVVRMNTKDVKRFAVPGLVVAGLLVLSVFTLVSAQRSDNSAEVLDSPLFEVRTQAALDDKLDFITGYVNDDTTGDASEFIDEYLSRFPEDESFIQENVEVLSELYVCMQEYVMEFGGLDGFVVPDDVKEKFDISDHLDSTEHDLINVLPFSWEGTCDSTCGSTCDGPTCGSTCPDTCDGPTCDTCTTTSGCGTCVGHTCTEGTTCGETLCQGEYTCQSTCIGLHTCDSTCMGTTCGVTCPQTCETCGEQTCYWPC